MAVVVDPAYAIERYLDECERRGVRLVGVLETHTHADHVSGHGRLALEHGLPVHIHAAAEAAFPHEALPTAPRSSSATWSYARCTRRGTVRSTAPSP